MGTIHFYIQSIVLKYSWFFFFSLLGKNWKCLLVNLCSDSNSGSFLGIKNVVLVWMMSWESDSNISISIHLMRKCIFLCHVSKTAESLDSATSFWTFEPLWDVCVPADFVYFGVFRSLLWITELTVGLRLIGLVCELCFSCRLLTPWDS